MEDLDSSSLIPSFRKPIEAIVLMPTVGSLSPLTRKLFNEVLHATQLQAAQVIAEGRTFTSEEYFAGHVFEAPLKNLLRPIEGDNSDTYQITSAKKCFREMRRTESDWAAPDAGSEVIFSSMSLLSQAELTKRKGIVYASWAFPPKLMRVLINPKMYMLPDNEQTSKLKTYAAIALYEICVRFKFKDKPTALTAVQELEWWVDALTASPKKDKAGKVKLRPWSKFKYDQGNKAIEEINEKTNILIELIEHKGQGKTVVSAQFKVTHKDMLSTAIETKSEIRMSAELAELTVSAGVDPKIVLGLLKNGQSEVGLKAAMVKFKNRKSSLEPILSVSAYLSKMLQEINEMINHDPQAGNQSKQTVLPAAAAHGNQVPLPMAMSFKDERRTEIREELLSLEVEAQKVYAYLALAELRKSKMARASTSERVEAGTWTQDPLLISKMVDIYANEKYGPDWGNEKPQV